MTTYLVTQWDMKQYKWVVCIRSNYPSRLPPKYRILYKIWAFMPQQVFNLEPPSLYHRILHEIQNN